MKNNSSFPRAFFNNYNYHPVACFVVMTFDSLESIMFIVTTLYLFFDFKFKRSEAKKSPLCHENFPSHHHSDN